MDGLRVQFFIGVFLAEVGLDHVRVALDVRRRAFGDLAPVVEDADVVGNIHDDAHVVFDQQDGDSFVSREVLQQFVELAPIRAG
jgi:hypothetical protein